MDQRMNYESMKAMSDSFKKASTQLQESMKVMENVANMMEQIQSYPDIVGNAWIGGDADSFAEKVVTKLLPAIAELIAAIAGINLNLTDATNTVDEADQKIQGMAGQLGDLFGSI